MPSNNPFEYLMEYEDVVWFTYGDGIRFEGWVTEVSDEALFVMWRPSPIYAQAQGGDDWSPEDEWIRNSEIDVESILKKVETKNASSVKPIPWWKFWA